PFHPKKELDRRAKRVDGTQRAALIIRLDERMIEISGPEEMRRLVEILLARHLEADVERVRAAGLDQDQRGMLTLLDAAQMDGLRRGVLDMQSQHLFIERT